MSPTATRPSTPRSSPLPRAKRHTCSTVPFEHHTDGTGASDHVFALSPLSGYRFARCNPNIARRKLHPFAGICVPNAIEPLVGSCIDEELIAAHWDDIVLLGLSIPTGTVAPPAMLRRLVSYPRQNGVALALREIGRIERSCSRSTGSNGPTNGGRRRAS